MNIAIIPARLGSKRVPKKNIKVFHGQPIISYTIKNLIKSSIFSNIYVSTESKIIADIAKKYGASVPFLRDSNLSDDFTPTIPVIKNYINRLIDSEFLKIKDLNSVCCVYPANPFMQISDLKKAYKIFNGKKKNDYVFSAKSFDHPIQRAFLIKNNKIKYLFPINKNKRTQDLNKYFHDAGQFYIGNPSSWLKEKNIFSKNSMFVEINKSNYCDIDTQEDWDFALKLYKSKLKK